MASRQIALLRGINVGRAKRVAMADLRNLLARLGYTEVRTLLNSGNVVFTNPSGRPTNTARRIEQAVATELGVSARVTVFTAAEFSTAVAENPLLHVADDPTRLLVAFLNEPADRKKLAPLIEQDWHSEALAVGVRVGYLWCPEGLLASRLATEVGRVLGDAATIRNWATVMKIYAISHDGG